MPLMRCSHCAGDWLYIPHGYRHRADARADSISLTVGVMSPSALDIFDFLRRELLDSLLWRQRLPIDLASLPEDSNATSPHYEALFQQLGGDLQRLLREPGLAKRYTEQWQNRFRENLRE